VHGQKAADIRQLQEVLGATEAVLPQTGIQRQHGQTHLPAPERGNRTLMMDGGRIVFDVKGEERSKMTVDDLLEKFRENAGKALDNDRILLSKVEAGN